MTEQKQTILWENLHGFGSEFCSLTEGNEGARLQGTVIQLLEEQPHLVDYTIECWPDWRTRRVTIEVKNRAGSRRLELEADEQEKWSVNGEERPDLQGCLDVDLEITPATNTLPIRRLALEKGEQAVLIAVWVRFPDLTVETLVQEYRRVQAHQYNYRSLTSQFQADLEVDENGLVMRYGDYWQAAAVGADVQELQT